MSIELKTTTEIIKGVLSCADFTVIEKLVEVFQDNHVIDVNGVNFCKGIEVSRASFNNTMKTLQIANIITSSSMGTKGTRLKINNLEALKELIEE